MPDKSLKAADKQNIVKKLTAEMKRRYGGTLPKQNRNTFETLLFAACLEDSTQKDAEAAYTRLLEAFYDLNEIRVSSVSEIEHALGDVQDADWKAMRLREALQHTFEKYYAFDLETVRRKTQEAALKDLEQIPHQTPFIRAYVVQHALGAHVLPIDKTIHRLLMWLGLAETNSKIDDVADDLKIAFKKADGTLLAHLLKCVATDPALKEAFEKYRPAGPIDPHQAAERLAAHFKNPSAAAKKAKKVEAKVVSKKKPEKKPVVAREKKKPAASKPVKKVTKKRPVKKTSRRS